MDAWPERRSDVPDGWAVARLCEVTQHVPNINPGHEPELDVGYVDISAIDNTSFRISGSGVKRFRGSEAPSRARRPIQANDILFSNVRTYLRNIAQVEEGLDAQVCSTGFTVLRSNGAVEPKYLFRFVITDAFVEAVTPHQTGTHYPATSDHVVLSQPIPLPPLAEQGRIVARLEALLSAVTAARQRLARVPMILRAFRQSVLVAACSGKLTEDWRSQQSTSTGPDQTYPATEPADYPDSWARTTLGALTSVVTSGSRGWAKYYSKTGQLFIRAQDINTDRLILDDVAHITLPSRAEGTRTRVQASDILVTITGANVTKAALVETPLNEAYVSQHVALVRLRDHRLAPFAHRWLCSPDHGRKHLLDAAYGAGKPGLNLNNIREVPVALPTLEEQVEIVRRTEALFLLADTIELRLRSATARAESLTQAVLRKAFRGQLAPTEAVLAAEEERDYESGTALLERVGEATQRTRADMGEIARVRKRSGSPESVLTVARGLSRSAAAEKRANKARRGERGGRRSE